MINLINTFWRIGHQLERQGFVKFGQFLKNGYFYILPNLIKMKVFQELLNILKGDYDGHFFAQRYFGSQSLHRKKNLVFFCFVFVEIVRSVTLVFAMKIENPFLTKLAY